MGADRNFVRISACCWMVTSATTLCLIFVPKFLPPAPGIDSQAALSANALYMFRVWVAILHPFIALIAAAGVLAVRLRAATGAAICGFTFFALWAGAEGVQQSLILVALNWRWRPLFLAGDDSARAALRPLIAGLDAISDSLFFFLLFAFVAANIMYCAATWTGGSPLQRVIAVFFALAAALGVLSFATRFGGGVVPAGAMDAAYPLIQPAGRFLTGVWLWKSVPLAGVGASGAYAQPSG
jgi:hypothetical protein